MSRDSGNSSHGLQKKVWRYDWSYQVHTPDIPAEQFYIHVKLQEDIILNWKHPDAIVL